MRHVKINVSIKHNVIKFVFRKKIDRLDPSWRMFINSEFLTIILNCNQLIVTNYMFQLYALLLDTQTWINMSYVILFVKL